MKLFAISTLLALVAGRPQTKYESRIVEKKNYGHEFKDVAYLFANHQNRLPQVHSVKTSRRVKSRSSGHHFPARATHNNQDLLRELMSRKLISSRVGQKVHQLHSRSKQRKVIPYHVVRRYKHIMTNLPRSSGTVW